MNRSPVTTCSTLMDDSVAQPVGYASQQDSRETSAYDHGKDIELLCRLLGGSEDRSVLDVGAERRSFTRAWLCAGTKSVFAFEPDPANMDALRQEFAEQPRVQILELALATARSATLYVAEDKLEDCGQVPAPSEAARERAHDL